ncbi:hypothetical protein FKM82_023878 [Ascaphus truei]
MARTAALSPHWLLLLLLPLYFTALRGQGVAVTPGEEILPESPVQKPSVLIAIVARNSAHTLPYFLDCIDKLDYPKGRIAIW